MALIDHDILPPELAKELLVPQDELVGGEADVELGGSHVAGDHFPLSLVSGVDNLLDGRRPFIQLHGPILDGC